MKKDDISNNDLFLFSVLLLSSMHYTFLVMDSFQMDFRAFYVASKSILQGLNPYVNNITKSIEFWDCDNAYSLSRFIYPPTALVFLFPLSWARYGLSKFLFSCIIGLCLLLLFYIFKKNLKNETLLIAFFSFPVLTSFERGQIDILIILLVALFYLNKESFIGAMFLSIAISIKLLPGLLLIYFLFRGQFKIISRVLLCIFFIFFISLLIFDIELYYDYLNNFILSRNPVMLNGTFQELIENNRVMGYTFNHNYVHNSMSIFNALFRKICGSTLAGRLVPLLLMLLLGFIYRKFDDNEILFYSFALASLIVNDHLWIMGMVWYLPIFFIMVKEKNTTMFQHFLLIIPLYLPNNIIVKGYNMNYVLAVCLVLYFVCSIYFIRSPISKIKHTSSLV